MHNPDSGPSGQRWLQHLKPEERAEAEGIVEALEMHRKLMAPLVAERNRLRQMAMTRAWRAGARSHAA